MEPRDNPTDGFVDIIDFLEQQTSAISAEQINVKDLISMLGARSFSIAVLIFALPMIFPMPPGIPMLAGLIIALIGVQMLTGRSALWLPEWLESKLVSRTTFLKAYRIIRKYVSWMFKLVRPRFQQLTGEIARRIAGFLFLILGFVMVLPIPFGGNTPPALACSVLALSLTDRDGLIYISGLVVTAIALTLNFFIVVGLMRLFGGLY